METGRPVLHESEHHRRADGGDKKNAIVPIHDNVKIYVADRLVIVYNGIQGPVLLVYAIDGSIHESDRFGHRESTVEQSPYFCDAG